MSQLAPPMIPGLAAVVRAAAAQYEKQFAHETINHRRNLEKDMLIALSVFVRKYGRAALGFTK